ncbi:MAG TPA: antibiotic biosynthesis monooxygenase [Methylophilaceae bacterium]|nr:antibiotic biosynthesis monooxygenase [Methylophilaceae bacterium]
MVNRTTQRHPITAVITHRVEPARQAQYEQWLDEIVPVAERYPGHMGAVIIRPAAAGDTAYRIVLHFDSRAHLRLWLASQDRAELIAKADTLLQDNEEVELHREQALWFTPPTAATTAPRRWKQALLTWSALYPLVMTVSVLMGWLAHHLGALQYDTLRILLTTMIVVVLMIYVVMPRYTRLARLWLLR